MDDLTLATSEMPLEVAAELVRLWTQPGEPTLGMWFGWSQPGPDSNVKLGSAYGYVQSYILRQVLAETDMGFETASEIVRDAMIEFGIDSAGEMLDTKINDCGLVVADEVFIDFMDLDPEHRDLYRLKVLWVNTGTDGHNWSCEFGDYLAWWYGETSKVDARFEAYEGCYDLTQTLLDWEVDLAVYLPETDYGKLRPNDDTLQWVIDNDIADLVFGPAEGYRDIDSELAWSIDQIVTDWADGNLRLDESAPGIVGKFVNQARQIALL